MSTTVDLRLVPKVKALIERYGAAAQLVRPAQDYDPSIATTASERNDTYSVKATPPSPFKKGFLGGETSDHSGLSTLVAASGLAIVPKAGDRFVLGAASYRVVTVGPIHSGDDVCAYLLEVAA